MDVAAPDFPDRGPAVFAVTTATLVVASVFVAARIVCRYFIVRNVTWDDRVMILAWLIAFFLSFTIDLGAANGLGRHDKNIPEPNFITVRHCEYVFSILYNPALMATKTSILIFYLRLAKNTQLVLRFASWTTLVIVNVAGLVLTIMNIFQCRPVEAAWAPVPRDGTLCIPLLTEFICAAPVNVVTDLVILALPIPVLTGMRLPSRQKTILVLTFTLGVFVTIVDVVRIYYLQHAITEVSTVISTDSSSFFGGHPDFSWNASLTLMWSAVEVNIGMMCACIPTLKPLILKLLPAMLYDPTGTRTSAGSKAPNDSEIPLSRTQASVAKPPLAAPGSSQPCSPDYRAPLSSMEFLTTPDMVLRGPDDSSRAPGASSAARTNATASTSTAAQSGIYFGFVNMARPKSMLKTSAAESFKYCTIVSILFSLWGLSYGLLDTLNNALAATNNMADAQKLGLLSAYFGAGYFFGPLLVGEWILRRDEHRRSRRHGQKEADNVGGFKVTFIVGLGIYGVGTIIFWPSAVTNSYGGFMLSSFVVGFGLSVLEVGANAFMILCGPPDYGATRLLLAQGVQAVSSVLSGLLAQRVFFKSFAKDKASNDKMLINVQWTYLGITLLCVVLGLFFYYMPLPEVSDGELEQSANRLPVDPKKRSIGGLQLRTVSLVLAVFTQYLYVGAQEGNNAFFQTLFDSKFSSQNSGAADDGDGTLGIALSIPDYLLIGHALFAVSRFMVGYLTYLSVAHPRLPQPRTYLTISVALFFLFSLLSALLSAPDPNLGIIPMLLLFFAEGPIWPLIFTIGLRGQGLRTKRAAAFITMGGSGGAVFPFIMYGIIKGDGKVQTAYIVIVALQVASMVYPLFLDLSGDARRLVDSRRHVHRAPRDEEISVRGAGASSGMGEAAGGFLSKVSMSFGAKLGGSRKSSQQADVEHSEGSAKSSPRRL